MEKRWASIKLILVLLCLGVMPLTLEVPLPFAFALLALALVAAVPLFLQFVRTIYQRFFAPVQPPSVRSAASDTWQLLLPVAVGSRGTVRSRAPSRLLAAHG